MTKLFYTPDDGLELTWDFEQDKLMNVELIAIEKVTGTSWLEFAKGLDSFSVTSLTALVWIMRKRHDDPTLQYADVAFPMTALRLETDEDDVPKDDPAPPRLAVGN